MDAAQEISRDLLVKAINESHDGITIADARADGQPIIYANTGFEQMTGYAATEAIGKSYRFLQGTDTNQPEIETIRNAIRSGEGCVVILRNYRKDGTLFWNELSISPVRDAEGKPTHYIGIQKDVTARVLLEQHLHQTGIDLTTLNRQLNTLVYTDPLIGISNRRRFDETFANFFSAAQRTHGELSVLMINLDQFKLFNQRYGKSAGDECLRIVGDRIAKSFSRSSDCAARYDDARFSVVSLGVNFEDLQRHAQQLCAKVRALGIPHGDSPHGIVTISVGGVSRVPNRDTSADELIKLAEAALHDVMRHGRDQVHVVS
ncbi:MAG TPA: diguanylate cyclase [Gallionella sp.]|jgi:diguanylate cyclase (GGDEF)-like protein/PAS domain S-box-containing protein|nr:diguanylate cyclase [Gallionella sp.]